MNCCYRFLQGPETDPTTVRKIRDAIDNNKDVTVQLINYTKTGKFGLILYLLCTFAYYTFLGFFIYMCLSVCSFLWFILVNIFHLLSLRQEILEFVSSAAYAWPKGTVPSKSGWKQLLNMHINLKIYFFCTGRGSVFHWGTTRWK